MTTSLWWICDGCLQLVWKWTVSACSTSPWSDGWSHSCRFLHLCLHALLLLYRNNEMLRAGVSVVGRSVLSLPDVMVKMQLLLLFKSVPCLHFFFFLQPFWRWPSNLNFYCRRIVQIQLLHFCNGTLILWRAFTSYIPEINSWDDDFCTVCCSFSDVIWQFGIKLKQNSLNLWLVFKYLKY